MWTSILRRLTVVVSAAAVVLFAGLRCGHGKSAMPDTPAPSVTCNQNGVAPALDCAALPNTSAVGQWVDQTGTAIVPQPANGQATATAYLDYDLWAWNSFVAMNWPAVVPSSANGYQRGFPDQAKSFANATPTDLTVWETYKEKREVFLYDYQQGKPSTQTPNPWNSAPQYGPSDSQVPCCPGSSCAVTREIGSGSKLFFDTLDETAEVSSEARETQAALCAGWVDPATECNGQPGQNPCCTLTGSPVGPRVWRGNPFVPPSIQPLQRPAAPVVYEVKINYDSFQYIFANALYGVDKARSSATAGQIRLPVRTSGGALPPKAGSTGSGASGPNPGMTAYDAQKCLSATGTPCPSGAVHLKAAWLHLQPGDDPSRYHTARALSYRSLPGGGICKAPSTFGLVGLHIIQRIHQTTNTGTGPGTSDTRPQGGTYIFATWEHTANDAAGFTYANYQSSATPVPYPNIKAAPALPLGRAYQILPSTQRATQLVHSKLGCTGARTDSVWCNYELVGTQYAATQIPAPAPALLSTLPSQPMPNVEAPANSGQPYYLANLVVESNLGLQQFQGLPPAGTTGVITVIDQYKNHNFSAAFSPTAYEHTANNLAFRTQKNNEQQFTMGGCMGCHGVAQLSGYSFSFVLLDNQYGAIPDSQHSFTIPPTPGPPAN